MTETRTTSSTGGQKGVKPQRYDLMPKEGLDAIAELFGYGAMKYADHNWRLGYEWSKGIAAMERHTQAHKNGETYDNCGPTCPDIDRDWCREHSRLPHLAAVGFHVLVGLTWLKTQGEGVDNPMDDRWPAAMERRRLAQEAEVAAQRSEMVMSGLLTEGKTIHLTMDNVSMATMSVMTGVPEDELLDALEYQGPRPTNGVQRSFGEIPVEDLRI